MKSNETLQTEVLQALKWEPLLNVAHIGVSARDGIITLTGIVDSYSKKYHAENAAKNVAGVKAVVEKIEVKFGTWGIKDDNEIAKEIVNSFKWNWEIPESKIKIKHAKTARIEGGLSRSGLPSGKLREPDDALPCLQPEVKPISAHNNIHHIIRKHGSC